MDNDHTPLREIGSNRCMTCGDIWPCNSVKIREPLNVNKDIDKFIRENLERNLTGAMNILAALAGDDVLTVPRSALEKDHGSITTWWDPVTGDLKIQATNKIKTATDMNAELERLRKVEEEVLAEAEKNKE